MDGPVTGKGVRYSSPVGSSGELIAQNTPILVDYAGIFSGYVVDMTRMFVFGDLAPVLKNAFAVSCDIQTWLVENLKPGQDCEELYIGALKIAEGAGLADNFMGHPGEQSRFVGHGVGLELDELPLIAKGFNAPLQDGQALAIEPKFVFPGQGVVGIENTWLVTPSGGEKLTALADDLMYL
jgi:Xaa-Pro aminopeptidase